VTNFKNFGLAKMLRQHYGPIELAQSLQQEAQTWERLLYSSGGQLELSKCLYYLMIFDSKPDGSPVLRPAEEMGIDLINLTTGTSTTTTRIEHRDCSTAHKTLGLHPAPNGCQLQQIQELRLKSDRFASGLATAPLSTFEARTALWTMWLPSMVYVLPCTHMTKTQLHHIQKKMVSISLSKRGYSSKTPRAVVFGPRRFLGIGDRHLYFEQGIGATLQLIKHIRSSSALGDFFQILLDWTQYHAGVSFSILDQTHRHLPHLEPGWVPGIRLFLGGLRANIFTPTMILPRPLRVHDCILVDDILANDFKPRLVTKLNYCRLYLQVERLSDICNTTGTCILPSVWKGERPQSQRVDLPTNQAKPHDKSWTLWRRFLKLVYLHPSKSTANSRSTDLRLDQPLGPWIGDRHLAVRRWPTYVSLDGSSLYHLRDGLVYYSSRNDARTRQAHRFPRASVIIPALPTDVVPATAILSPTTAILRPVPYPKMIPDPLLLEAVPPPLDFVDMLRALPEWQSSLLAHLAPKFPHDTLKQRLECGDKLRLYLVSDGGAKGDLGSFGWGLSIGTTVLWTNMGPTFGVAPGSFRAESYGFLSALLFFEHYLRYYTVDVSANTDHIFFCDNLGLIQRIRYSMTRPWDNPNSCLASEYDVESGIVEILTRLPVTFALEHVKGHQDIETAVEALPWEAQLNCISDALATDYLDNHSRPSKRVPFIPASKIDISIDGVTITSHLARRLRQAASSPALEEHIMQKNGWNDWTFNSIDWDPQAKALSKLTYTQEQFATKLAHNLLPTRRHMKRIKQTESDLCPSCLETEETTTHIFACIHRIQWHADFIASLRKVLDKLNTQPDLKMMLLQGISGAIHDPTFELPTTDREANFEILASSQNDIGCSQMIRGRFSIHWSQLQQAHIEQDDEICGEKFTGPRWLEHVLFHLWTSLYLAWKLRNADLHGIDTADRERKSKAKLRPQVVALYQKAASLNYLDKRLFALDLDDRLGLRSSEQAAWINVVSPTVRQAKAEADAHLRNTQHDIREYFTRHVQAQIVAPPPIPRLFDG
jgi:hypothetical protein